MTSTPSTSPSPSLAAPPRVELAPGYQVSPVINGCWQLARGHAPRRREPKRVLAELEAIVDAGGTTFDCSDVFAGVEELLASLRDRLRERRGADAPSLEIHTTFAPERELLPKLRRRQVEAAVDRSLVRLGVERLDLVQLHWWDFGVPRYLGAFEWLEEQQRAGKIRHLGLANFDAPRLRELLDAGFALATHQLQYSVLDRRPARGVAALCDAVGVKLLCHGTLAGGFLSSGYLGCVAPPAQLANRSLTKYRLIVDEFGGWGLFQDLLVVLAGIAERHGVDLSAVAARYVLEQRAVTALVVGVRDLDTFRRCQRVFELALDQRDHAQIDAVLELSSGPGGDVYALERSRRGPLAAIHRREPPRLARALGS